MTTQTLLVTGASGQLGRRVIELLLAGGARHIIATTRSPEKLTDLAANGVDVRPADFDDDASLEAAFAGADRLLLISTDALDRRTAQQQRAVAAAQRAGVKHVVYTSLSRSGPGVSDGLLGSHVATEEALEASTLDWTVLRNNLYTDMFLQSMPRAIASGQLVAAAGQGGAAYVTREDCARAAAAVLLSDTSGRTTYDISGPASITHEQLARIVTDITGTQVVYVPVELETIVGGMVAAGLPEPVARIYASFDDGIAQGSLATVSSAVADLTGQGPQSVHDFLLQHRSDLTAA